MWVTLAPYDSVNRRINSRLIDRENLYGSMRGRQQQRVVV